ncbi:MAG: ZIP family metal transporter [Bacteroidetes bacterium]|jgi:ZIP family zinc transporter|nr:ZIP family metal transporter [Bacteroidota bacterium]
MFENEKSIIFGTLFAFILLTILSLFQQNWKIVGISWTAFLSMAAAMPIGIRSAGQNKFNHLIAGYGLASGAMITSAAIFLVPTAINHHPVYGGLGIAAGVISGFAIHSLNHGLTHTTSSLDSVVIELTSHALTAGVIIGTVYAAMPELSILLGLAIVSHKAPAGYAASQRLAKKGKSARWILLPAAAVGITALPVSLLNVPGNDIVNALIFGFATGVFFHVAMDFLPECEVGGNIHKESDLTHKEHYILDEYRKWAVLNTFTGGFIVFLAWYLIS